MGGPFCAYVCLSYTMRAVRYILLVLFLTLSVSEARNCPIKNICKRIRMVQKKLRKATEAMTTQGKMISGRLDAAEGKIDDIGNIGKKLTDLLSQQGTKIQEQGTKLAAEETKLREQLKVQLSTFTTKMESYATRVTALSEQNTKLTDLVTAQDTRIGGLQTEGIKILDKLEGTTKKLQGKVTAQTTKLSAQLPLPDGKFTEIAKGHTQCEEKMAEFEKKFESMNAMMAALKEKLTASESKLSAVGDTHVALAGKADAVGLDIEAQEKASADITAKLGETDAKIGDIAAQGATIADNLAQATAKVGTVASAKLKMKEKLTKQMEAAAAIKEQALSVAGKMKEHEAKLGKVQAELDAPPPPPPPPKGNDKLFGIIPNPFGKK